MWIVAETGANELMVVSDIYDHNARLHSYELIAAAHAENGSVSKVEAGATPMAPITLPSTNSRLPRDTITSSSVVRSAKYGPLRA